MKIEVENKKPANYYKNGITDKGAVKKAKKNKKVKKNCAWKENLRLRQKGKHNRNL
jgi:hypothetical protein